jgi:hypothetical protein
VAAVVLAATVLLPRLALAWCRTTTNEAFVPSIAKPCDDVGRPLAWKSKCVGYFVQASGSHARAIDVVTARAAAKAAFGAWSAIACPLDAAACAPDRGDLHPSIAAIDLGTASCTAIEYSQTSGNANLVLFRDDGWPHPDGDTTLALTTVSYDADTGELFDADIELNSGEHPISTDGKGPFDLQGILTHEAGHFFGLAHTQPVNADAVMSIGSEKRTPALDDACGICTVYDPKRVATCDPAPRHGVASCAEQPSNDTRAGCHCSLTPARDGGDGAGAFAVMLGLVGLRCARRRATAARPAARPRRRE